MFWPCGQSSKKQRTNGLHLHSEREKADTLRPFPRNAVGTRADEGDDFDRFERVQRQVDNTVHALVSGRLAEVHTTVTSSTRGTATAG